MHMTTETQQPEDLARLYRRAFAEYGARALWNKRELETPTPADALVVARALRMEGNREARQLAEQIERACRAAIYLGFNRHSPPARRAPRPGKLRRRGRAVEPRRPVHFRRH